MGISWWIRLGLPAVMGALGVAAQKLGTMGGMWAAEGESIGIWLLGLLCIVVNLVGVIAVPLAILLGIILIADGIIDFVSSSIVNKVYMWGCVFALTIGTIGVWTNHELGLHFKSVFDAFEAFLEYLIEFKPDLMIRCLFALFPERSFVLAGILFVLALIGVIIEAVSNGSKVYDVISCIVAIACTILCASALIGVIVMILITIGILAIAVHFKQMEWTQKMAHESAWRGTVAGTNYEEAKYIVDHPEEFGWFARRDAEYRLKELDEKYK